MGFLEKKDDQNFSSGFVTPDEVTKLQTKKTGTQPSGIIEDNGCNHAVTFCNFGGSGGNNSDPGDNIVKPGYRKIPRRTTRVRPHGEARQNVFAVPWGKTARDDDLTLKDHKERNRSSSKEKPWSDWSWVKSRPSFTDRNGIPIIPGSLIRLDSCRIKGEFTVRKDDRGDMVFDARDGIISRTEEWDQLGSMMVANFVPCIEVLPDLETDSPVLEPVPRAGGRSSVRVNFGIRHYFEECEEES